MKAAALCAVLASLPAAPATAERWQITGARFAEPTDIYDHAVLGDALEWRALAVQMREAPKGIGILAVDRRGETVFRLPAERVFEDQSPRLWDVDGDGLPEVVVVETSLTRGAALAVYDATGKRAATPFIGTPYRWLAPAAAGDFDGDGRPEIAYVDRPHLARELVFVRLEGDALVEVARAPGFSNHRIGDKTITGALRTCDGVAEVILPDADWMRVLAARIVDGKVATRDVGPYRSATDIARAARC